MSKVKLLLDVVEDLRSLADSVQAVADEEKLWNYQTAMAMARKMLSQGIITGKEYAKIDATIAKKYGVSSCSIFR